MLPHSERAQEACQNASMVVASAPVARLTVGGLSEFLEDVQLALVEIHERVDDTYFRPSFVGWEPTVATR